MTPTTEQVIQMARDVGFDIECRNSIDGDEVVDGFGGVMTDKLVSIAAIVHAAARAQALEDAAKLADSEGIPGTPIHTDEVVADWLRALKGKQ
jgi:hypothetical protein